MSESEIDIAILAWCRYHVATEAFDRSISTLRNERGDAVISHDSWIHGRSYEFARQARSALGWSLAGVSQDATERAKRIVCDWSYESQREYIERSEKP